MGETDGGTQEQLTEQVAKVHRLVHHGAQAIGHQVDHGAQAIGHQVDHAPVGAYPEVEQAVRAVQDRLVHQDADLEQRLACLGHAPDPAPPDAELPPSTAERAAEAITGDQAYLQHLSLEYQRLQAASRPQGDTETTELAERGHEETQYLLRERLSRAAPRAAQADRPLPSMNPPGVVEGGRPLDDRDSPMPHAPSAWQMHPRDQPAPDAEPGVIPPCPACHMPGVAAAPSTGTLLFACETPDWPGADVQCGGGTVGAGAGQQRAGHAWGSRLSAALRTDPGPASAGLSLCRRELDHSGTRLAAPNSCVDLIRRWTDEHGLGRARSSGGGLADQQRGL